MKKSAIFALIFLMLLCTACGESKITDEEENKQNTEIEDKITMIDELTNGKEYNGIATEVFSFVSEDPMFRIVQGGCFDGENFCVAVVNKDEKGYEIARLLIITKDGKILRESKPLPLDHTNNITYNKSENVYVVSHCQSPDGHYNRYSKVNPETFEIVKTADLEYPFFSMAYCDSLKRYASGEWAGQTLDVWNKDMKPLLHKDVEMPKTLSQGVFCDEGGIYFVRSSQNGVGSEIRVYTWDCELVKCIPLNIPNSVEPESINIIDGVAYIIGTERPSMIGKAYTLKFEER